LKVTVRLLDRRQSYRVVCRGSWLQRTAEEPQRFFSGKASDRNFSKVGAVA
jgi:hypothetical protein